MIRQDQVREGLRVKLLPFKETAQPEQKGTVLSPRAKNDTVIVDIDRKYRDDEFDDGLREVPLDQLEILHG